MKNHVFGYNFLCVNVREIRICHLVDLFIRYTSTNFHIENKSAKRASSHFTFAHNSLLLA